LKSLDIHVSNASVMTAASTGVDERVGALDAKIAEQRRRVDATEPQGCEVAEAIAHMKPKAALVAAANQGKHREATATARQGAADVLVGLQGQRRPSLEAERLGVVASAGPARFLAIMVGTDAETVIRWLVALLVARVDPSAIALTVARRGGIKSKVGA